MLLFPIPLLAEEQSSEETPLTRREGFIMIWESILRPTYETTQVQPFIDVYRTDSDYQTIIWAKRRHILEDDSNFWPNEPLILRYALLWLYRTRNIVDITQIRWEDLPSLRERYPIISPQFDWQYPITSEVLKQMMYTLDTMLLHERHEVSFYGDEFRGEHTAFGEIFNPDDFTAAHRSFPYDTLVRVTNVENGKNIVVRINDRGPYVDGRDMDLSLAAFLAIADRSHGLIHATFQRLGDKDLVQSCSQEPRYQRRITREVRFYRGVPHVLPQGEALSLGSTKWFVVHSIQYPDGTLHRVQDFVRPKKEHFSFKPSVEGQYVFSVGTPQGRRRDFVMNVVNCLSHENATQVE